MRICFEKIFRIFENYLDRSWEKRRQKLIVKLTPKKYRNLPPEKKAAMAKDLWARLDELRKRNYDKDMDYLDSLLTFFEDNREEYQAVTAEYQASQIMMNTF